MKILLEKRSNSSSKVPRSDITMKPTILFAALLIAVVSCGPSAESGIKPGTKTKVIANTASTASDLMPFQKGNAWVLTARSVTQNAQGQREAGGGEVTLKCIAVEESGGNKVATLDVKSTVGDPAKTQISTTDKGVFQVSYESAKGKMLFNPPFPLMPYGLKPGETIKYDGSGPLPGVGKVGPIKATITFKGEVELDTGAGRVKALRADNTQTYKDGNKTFQSMQSYWFAPKIGLVRSLNTIVLGAGGFEQELILKTYTVK